MGLFVQEFPTLLLSNDSDPGSNQINLKKEKKKKHRKQTGLPPQDMIR